MSAPNKVEDFSSRGCGYERCLWRRMVLDTSEPSVAIFRCVSGAVMRALTAIAQSLRAALETVFAAGVPSGRGWMRFRRREPVKPNPYWLSEVVPRVDCGASKFSIERLNDTRVLVRMDTPTTDLRGDQGEITITSSRIEDDAQPSLDQCLRVLRQLAHGFVCHEMDETLRFDGALVCDPHPFVVIEASAS